MLVPFTRARHLSGCRTRCELHKYFTKTRGRRKVCQEKGSLSKISSDARLLRSE